jgi:hypothetical protein
MDLGIRGRTATARASSQGLGKAWAATLAGAGVNPVINGRDALLPRCGSAGSAASTK